MEVLGSARALFFLAIIVIFIISLHITKSPLKKLWGWGWGRGNRIKCHNNCYDDCHGEYHAVHKIADGNRHDSLKCHCDYHDKSFADYNRHW